MDHQERLETHGEALLMRKDVMMILGIGDTSLRKIEQNHANNFPKPINLSGPKRYSLKEINQWIDARRVYCHSAPDPSTLNAQIKALVKGSRS